MDRIKLNVLGITSGKTQTGAYVLVLEDEQRTVRIPIVIRVIEAESIALELEGLKSARPLTHDLLADFASAFSIHISEVEIDKLEEGVFYAKIVFESNNNTVIMDARLSDAVALALRFKAPIYTYKEIIEKAGIHFKTDTVIPSSDHKESLKEKIKKLQSTLEKAIQKEDYELASQIKKELDRLKLEE